ncbi:LysR substrate-binding domain-containing protein [Pendulispora rubella]|uniref:LysR substrate-binding domain-containing protein n=1 Tax=Pendulispora rubella TaxID=2741070 RepID=A0ABZ2KSP3_9BACT
MVELRHLRYFLVLAEELHFGRAARRLHIAQPGLSQQIQALERELGVELVDRSRRRMQLTAAGRTFFEEGRRGMVQLERAIDLARRAGRGEVGRLSLGAAESATYAILPSLLRAYVRRYPDVDLAVREMSSGVQLAALERGEIDIAFIRTPVEIKDFETMPLTEESMALVLPEDHPLARKRMVPLTALSNERFILHPTPASGWTEFMYAVCRHAGFEPRISQSASETTVAVSFVAAGLGVTLVPESLSDAARRPGVVTRPVASPVPNTQLLVVYPREGLPETARAFLEIVRQWER